MAKRPLPKLQNYNPLGRRELGTSVAKSLLEREISPLPPTETFEGAGIYAIYYAGDFPGYEFIREKNLNDKWECPIYVGKAVPKGARKGGFGLGLDAGPVLYARLCKHADTLTMTGLPVEHFRCRYLAVEDIWIPLGESLLIEMFQPIWNSVLEGFGNNDPGSGRYGGMRPAWHVVHPGVGWAAKCQPHAKSAIQLIEDVAAFHEGKLKPKLSPEETVLKESADSNLE